MAAKENTVGEEGVKALAEALRHNSTLTKLNLRSNKVGADGCIALKEALRHNSALTELCLDCKGHTPFPHFLSSCSPPLNENPSLETYMQAVRLPFPSLWYSAPCAYNSALVESSACVSHHLGAVAIIPVPFRTLSVSPKGLGHAPRGMF